MELAGHDDNILRELALVDVPEAADRCRDERVPLRHVEAQFVSGQAFAVLGHDADDDRVEVGRVAERAAQHQHAACDGRGAVAADGGEGQHRALARLQRCATLHAVVAAAPHRDLLIGRVQRQRRLRQAGDGGRRGHVGGDAFARRRGAHDRGRRLDRDRGRRAVRFDARLVGQPHLLHRQAVERHLSHDLLVIDTKGAAGFLIDVLLFGFHQRAADAGIRRRAAAGLVAQLIDEVEHQPFGVGQQIHVAIAEAGVADEGRALGGEHLRPVRAHERRARVVPLVAYVQARLAADGEDERTGEVVGRVVVQLVGEHQVIGLGRAAVGVEQSMVKVGVE